MTEAIDEALAARTAQLLKDAPYIAVSIDETPAINDI